jgi:threonine synthase
MKKSGSETRTRIGEKSADAARFPGLTKNMRSMIAISALKKAKDNYYKKYDELNEKMFLTSANSINLARFLPQSFYYFWAYAQMKRIGRERELTIAVPSGNLGNLTAGLFAKRMGLPVKRFVSANNSNDIVYNYLQTNEYKPRPSVSTIANAMDVGDPSNFARIMQLYNNNHQEVCKDICGATYDDQQIADGVKRCLQENNYLLDPHGACGYLALKEQLKPDETGVFLETAHPAKFKATIDNILSSDIEIPLPLQEFMKGEKVSIGMSTDFEELKSYLMR